MLTPLRVGNKPLSGTTIGNLQELEDRLSRPTQQVVDALSRLSGDILVLGAGGKMGPSLARMAQRASTDAGEQRRVIAVSRFSDPQTAEKLNAWGVETIQGDLFDPTFVESLPACPYVVFMLGFKFGTSHNPAMTWATNVYIPALVCRHFPTSRIVAFSSGNVYGPVPVKPGDGSVEPDTLHPVGEYSMSALGRERIFEYFSQTNGTLTSILRLNYSTEMRYGVLVDIATQVWKQQPINLGTAYVNVIWQGDANAYALCSLEHAASPPFLLNMTGPDRIRCRDLCTRFGEKFDKKVELVGSEGPKALLNDSSKAHQLYGPPQVSLDQLIDWTANWVANGGANLNKPTHYEVTDGKF